MEEEDKFELLSRRLSDSVEHDLKKKYTWIGLLTGGGSGLLITLIVSHIFSEPKQALVTAQKLQEITTERLMKTQESVEVAKWELSRARDSIRAMSGEFRLSLNELDEEAKTIRQNLTDRSLENISLSSKNHDDLEALRKVVSGLNERFENDSRYDEVKTQLQKLQASQTETKSDIKTASSNTYRANYFVSVEKGMEMDPIRKGLDDLGFSTRTYRPKLTYNLSNAALTKVKVLFGTSIPMDIAFNVLQAVRQERLEVEMSLGNFEDGIIVGWRVDHKNMFTTLEPDKTIQRADFEKMYERLRTALSE